MILYDGNCIGCTCLPIPRGISVLRAPPSPRLRTASLKGAHANSGSFNLQGPGAPGATGHVAGAAFEEANETEG